VKEAELHMPLMNLRVLVVDDSKMNQKMMGWKFMIGDFKDLALSRPHPALRYLARLGEEGAALQGHEGRRHRPIRRRPRCELLRVGEGEGTAHAGQDGEEKEEEAEAQG